jgi:hypothetical protein
MRFLFVAATDIEIAPLVARLTSVSHGRVSAGRPSATARTIVDVLVTGVGHDCNGCVVRARCSRGSRTISR